ncbi:MAG: SelB C-terminal domain-containing protein [Candidatus Aminicenantes bacterium]|nr:SelB C-terminal domain-containing protein [Candidatus Aminicenantes bacterium]
MNSFLVHLKIKEASFPGIVVLGKKNYSGSFKKISEDIFHVYFKQKVIMRLNEKVELKSRSKFFTPLLPVFTESNKKKLTKIAKSLNEDIDTLSAEDVILLAVNNEKALNVLYLEDFLSMNRRELLDILIRLESEKKIKLMDLINLYSCSYKIFTDNFNNMVEKLSNSYNSRLKTIKFSDIAGQVIFHPDSIYFRYMLEKTRSQHDFRILKDKLVFTELPLSEKEISMVNEVEKVIKKNKLGIFSIYSIRKVSEFDIGFINNSLWHLLSEEKIVPLDEKREYFIFSDELTKIINRLKKFKRNQGDMIDISSFREISVLNRKNIILVLEYLDSQKITTRIGNNRKIELQV